MPKRPLQHQLEDESRKAFEAILPSRLVYRSVQPDYGIDGEVEEFAEDFGEATGVRFLVQLKATGKEGAEAMRERIKLDSAAYYRAQHLPVLMVRFLAGSNQLFGRWFHRFDAHYEHVGTTHLTFHWSEEDLISSESVARLLDEAERVVRLRVARLELPVSVALDVPERGVHGFSRTELELAIEAAMACCSGALELGAQQEADIGASISEDEIRADLSGISSVTFHLGEGFYPPCSPTDQITNDVLSCLAVALARAGHGEPAARIAVRCFPHSLLSAIPPTTAELFAAMVQAGRVVEVLDVVDALDQDGEEARETAAATYMASVWPKRETLQPHEQRRLEATLRARFERRLEVGRSADAAGSAENIGRYLMGAKRHAEAADFLARAIELDSNRETDDLVQLLAGAYFLDQQYKQSILAYGRALELATDHDPHLEARLADALLYSGRYTEALQAFREIEVEDRRVSAWIYVKVRVLEWVTQSTGIECQERDRDAAEELAGQWEGAPSDSDVLAARVWECDAMSPLGWFNRARDFLDRNLLEEAKHAYLATAVMQEGDVEAWVNVAILAGQSEDFDLFAASAITGHRLNQDRYLGEFARQLKATDVDVAAREQLLTAVRKVVTSEEVSG